MMIAVPYGSSIGLWFEQALPIDMLIAWQQLPPYVLPLIIFTLRATDLTVATLRMLTVIRGHRSLAWVLAFLQAMLFISTVSGVLSNLNNLWNLVAYAAGFGTGNVIGMTLEGIFAPGHSLLRITSRARGSAIAEALRAQAFGVTELSAQGLHGTVDRLLCFLPRRKVSTMEAMIYAIDPQAFITVEHVRQLHGGYQA